MIRKGCVNRMEKFKNSLTEIQKGEKHPLNNDHDRRNIMMTISAKCYEQIKYVGYCWTVMRAVSMQQSIMYKDSYRHMFLLSFFTACLHYFRVTEDLVLPP